MNISIVSKAKRRSIGTSIDEGEGVVYKSSGRVSTSTHSLVKFDSIASLYPYFRNRQESISKTHEYIYVRENKEKLNLERATLVAPRKLVSSTKTSPTTLVVKGISLPAKQITNSLLTSATSSLFLSFTSMMMSSFSSFIGFALNVGLVYKDIRKNGGSPTYVTFVYSSYLMEFLTMLIALFFAATLLGSRYIIFTVIAVTSFFFLFNLLAKLFFIQSDRRTNRTIDSFVIDRIFARSSSAFGQ